MSAQPAVTAANGSAASAGAISVGALSAGAISRAGSPLGRYSGRWLQRRVPPRGSHAIP